MNRDEIIRMAQEIFRKQMKEADEADRMRIHYSTTQHENAAVCVVALAIAAAERERVAAWMMQHGYATGHGESTEDLLAELAWQIDARVAAEREACAQVAGPEDSYSDEWFAAKAHSAKLIRARGQA